MLAVSSHPSRSFLVGAVAGGLVGALVTVGVVVATADRLPVAAPTATTPESQAPPEPAPKNVILFIGDGMSVSTVTAARILEGQRNGQPGEENSLSFETFPSLALSKVYNVDAQVPDSAGTATALMSGVKTDLGVLNVDADVVRGDCSTVAGNELTTWMMLAEERGMSTGVVSTANLVDATPAATYAVSPERGWSNDSSIPPQCAGYPDIASQLLSFGGPDDGFEVALGGGRRDFLSQAAGGSRTDGRNLDAEWSARGPGWRSVSRASELDGLDLSSVDHLLGLFADGDMAYAHDRETQSLDQPSLSEMTSVAIGQLDRNPRGYALMVESGLIDKAHHMTNAYRALTETIELSDAVRAAIASVDMSETLIVVTADHGDVLVISGYPSRGNNILGLVDNRVDACGNPYTTLGYMSGPSSPGGALGWPASGAGPCGRPDLRNVDTTNPDFRQQALIAMDSETHSGEDVPVFAVGPGSEAFSGVREQDYFGRLFTSAIEATTMAPSP